MQQEVGFVGKQMEVKYLTVILDAELYVLVLIHVIQRCMLIFRL
jgi:hypothetical protein